MMARLSYESLDPLSLAIAPPENESLDQRRWREDSERQARQISQEIDEMINRDRIAMKKKKRAIKILLLGQSESGKSTTIKNFQLAYARDAWLEQRMSWLAVVHFNLVRSVLKILDTLALEMDVPTSLHSPTVRSRSPGPGHMSPGSGCHLPAGALSSTLSDDDEESNFLALKGSPSLIFTEKHKLLKLRLAPLREIHQDLESVLGTASTELEDLSAFLPLNSAAPFMDYEQCAEEALFKHNPRRPQEFWIHSNCGWKAVLDNLRPSTAEKEGERPSRLHERGPLARIRNQKANCVDVLDGCREDIKALWADEVVRAVLTKHGISLEDAPGFFLDDVDRIARRGYQPSDDDVVRARLRTLGVQEYSFSVAGRDWKMFDMAGARTSRSTWFSFFDDVNVILFLASASSFNETLAEDCRVNRMEDTFLLWRSVCSSQLLAKVQLILFLNKCDLLAKKLYKDNILIRDHVPSYKDRENDVPTATNYFKTKFKEIMRTRSPQRRPFYGYLTSVIDTESTAHTLSMVQDGILRANLQQADVL